MSSTETHGAGGLMRFIPARYHNLVRYLLIGGMASAIDVILFMVLYNVMGTSTLVAHSVSVPVAVLVSFFVNARHNFRVDDNMALRLLSFAAVCALGYLVGFGVINAVQQAGLGANLGKIASLPVVFAVQFILNSRITFRKAKGVQA